MNAEVRSVLKAVGKLIATLLMVALCLLLLPGIAAAGLVVLAIYPVFIGVLVVGLVICFIVRSKELPQYSWAGQLLYILWFPAFVVGVTAPIRALGVAGYSMPSMAWFDVAVGALGVGVTILLTALDLAWRRGQLEQLESLPTSKIRSAAIGLAEFRGKVATDTVPKDRLPPGELKGLMPFYLEDATGRILVDPRGAQVRSGWAGSFGGRTCEAVVPSGGLTAGGTVYVIGNVQRNPAAPSDASGSDALVVAPLDEPVSAGFFRRLLLVRHDRAPQSQRDIQHVFFLSDGTEEKARRHLRAGIGQVLVIAAVWMAASAWMIAAQLPKTLGIAHWSVREVIDFGKEARSGELVRRLQTRGPSERAKILEKIVAEDLKSHDAVVAAARGLVDPSPEVRTATIGCVMRLGEEKWRNELPPHHWPAVKAAVEAGLAGPDRNSREAALRIARMALKAPGMVPLLIRAADDPASDVRLLALYALGKLGPAAAPAAPTVVRHLEDESISVRNAAIAMLPAMFAGTDGRPIFRELLCHATPAIRKVALEGLASPAPEGDEVVGELMTALHDSNPEVRAQAADGLGRYGAAAAAAEPSLLALLSDPWTNVQGTAAQALAKVAPKPAEHVEAVAPLFGSDSWWVRRVAGDFLIALGFEADRAVPAAVEWLKCGSEAVQKEVLRFLQESWVKREAGCIGPAGAQAVEPVTRILRSASDTNLKNQAIAILGLLGEDAAPAVPAIVELREHSSHRNDVLRTLQLLGPAARAAAPAFVDELFGRDPWQATHTLVPIAPLDETQIARLIEGLRSDRQDVRGACVRVLAACGSAAADAAPALAEILRRQYDAEVISALVSIGPASVAPTAELLNHSDENVRSRAVGLLGRLGPAARPALEPLKRLLTDPPIRKQVTEAIVRIDPATALPALVALLKHKDAAVRKDAMQGLEKLTPAVTPPLYVLIEAVGDAATEAGAARILGGMGEAARSALPALLQAQKRLNSGLPGAAILKILKVPVRQESFEGAIQRHLRDLDPSDENTLSIGAEMVRLQLPGALEALVPRVAFGKGIGPHARFVLLQGLKNPSGWMKLCALEGLARIGPEPEVLSALREHLRTKPASLERETVRALRSVGPAARAAVPELRPLLKATWDVLAAETAAILGSLGPVGEEAREDLAQAAAKGSPRLREAAAVALARLSSPVSEPLERLWRTDPRSTDAADLYRELGGHADPVVREKAVLAWAWRRPEPQELAELVVALGDPHLTVRAAAAEVLAERGGAEPYLVPLLRDPSPRVRRLAAEGIKASTSAAIEAVPLLADLLRDPDVEIQRAAAWALSAAGPVARGTVDELIRIAKRGDDGAIAALGAIGPDAGPAVPFLIEQARQNLWRTGVIDALGKIGPAARDAVPLLVEGLSHQGQSVRWQCAEALGGIGPEAASAVPALLAAGRNRQDDRMFFQVSRSLAQIGPVALPALIDAFKGGHQAAASAIGQMGPAAAEAVPVLREALKGNDVVLQFLAIRALRGIGPPAAAAIPELRRFLSVQTNIRYEASRTLSSIEGWKR